ncbi:MAG: maleate cis-trans isomerase [Clostridiales bacterium]|nr:maleate cis-trans isomerase [Clostridiales bacterium]
MYYGWRGKIGLIFPATGTAPEHEFHRYAPDGIAVLTHRVLFERVTQEGLEALGDRVIEASKLLATAQPDLIVFACTTGSLIKGFGYDGQLIRRMEDAAGCKAITTSTAVIQALTALGSKRLVLSTPYSDAVNAAEKKFLEDSGFEVLKIKGLGYTDPLLMPRTTIGQMYKLNQEVLDPAADTLFVSCTGLGIMDAVPMFERDSRLKVVTSNQASLWAALRALSVNDDLGLGRLFQL